MLSRSAAALAGVGHASVARAASKPWVLFLNPDESQESGTGSVWRMNAFYMQHLADALGVRLEVRYSNRDHLLMLRQAEAVAAMSALPDYVVISNEKSLATRILKILARSPCRVLVIHSSLSADKRQQIGNERGPLLPRWIGTVTPDNRASAYRPTQHLHRQQCVAEPRIVGITGGRNTPVSLERAQGVQNDVEQAGRGRILQVAYSDWSYANGEQKARQLLARCRDANLVWAGSDSMTLGPLNAVKASGRPVLIGRMGGWTEALDSVAHGEIAATVAGHCLIGAWALALLHDHFHGLDFTAQGGPNVMLD